MLIAFFAIIYKPLNLQRPFQKSEVRDSECLVYEVIESQPIKVDFLLFCIEPCLEKSPKNFYLRHLPGLTPFHWVKQRVKCGRVPKPTDSATSETGISGWSRRS